MNREQIMSVLYDITLVIGGEVSLKPLLTKTVQRLLYHTSFPTGLVLLDVADQTADSVSATLAVAVGDFGFTAHSGKQWTLPAALLRGDAAVADAAELLAALPGATRSYGAFLRLPVAPHGVILLLAPHRPSTQLPLTEIFRPVMANLAKAILLCRRNDAFAAGLLAERDQAQQSLTESEEKFHSMATVAQDAIIMIDDEGHIAYWNPAAEKVFGYSAAEAINQDAHNLIAPTRYHERFRAGFARFRSSGGGPVVGTIMEIEGRRKDGNEFPAEISISAMNLRGRWHAVGLLRDITERHQAALALQRANRTLKTLSSCNAILVRALGESRLLADICQLIVTTGGYRGACVGYMGQDKTVFMQPVASAGVCRDEMGAIEQELAGPAGQGPATRAFRTGREQLVRITDTAGAAIANRSGIAAIIALPLLDGIRPFGVLKVYAAESGAFTHEEISLLKELAEDLAFGIVTLRNRRERERLEAAEHEGAERLKRALLGTIQAVALMVEKRDPYTAGHQQKVARLAVAIAQDLGWPADKIEGVRLGGMIHDIGKIYVPSEFLNRPGRLTELEYSVIRSHPEVGYEILKDVELPWPVAQIILQHHERLDGSGYPAGLKGEQIIPEARVLAVADTVEAITTHRPYRPALGLEFGLNEISTQRGMLFDPQIVDACLRVIREQGFHFE